MAAAMFAPSARAQVGFSASQLGGLGTGTNNNKANKVTSLQFGPDNKLYFTQVNGTVIICDVTRIGQNNYMASNVETIALVKNIPNYDDDGTRNLTLNTRQSTGILVTGTAGNPVIYVSSSDPREGAGSGATDLNLDTNSGIISRLTKNGGGVWEKVDIVRGLPRSEENHASNGLNIDPSGNKLYLAQGGNANAGSPSNNFAFSCETALSAAVLSIDLAAIQAMPVQTDAYGQQYIYNIPTVDDPNVARAHNGDGSDVNDPFGGNDGLNQARLVLGGPVQVHASGFRNPYDVMIAKTPGRAGKMYTFDNAANSGWGGYPKNEGLPAEGMPSTVTNEYVTGEAGTVNNLDNLHWITGAGYYGGHPNPIRANPTGAGWLRADGSVKVYSVSPTTDWPPVPPSMADPRQGDFRLPGVANGSLFTNSASTTGVAEYTANNFGGAMLGNIITTQYSNAAVQRLIMNADGTAVTGSSVLLNGSAYGTPLDVTCPGPGAAPALAGTIFVGHHSSKITILEPTDFESGGGNVCTGAPSFTLDEDIDGYSNSDEIANGSDPCSPAVLPPDRDGDFLSDLLDTDDDNDGISDTQDVFPIDNLNGSDLPAPMRYDLFNELGVGFFGIGFRGVMLNPGEDYRQRINETDLIAGGTAGLFTDPNVTAGNPHGASNTQVNAFQFGVNVDEFTGPFRVRSGLGGLLFNGLPTASQSHGIFIGNGDQDNYLKLAVNAASGPGAIEVVHEENGVILSQVLYPETGLFSDVVTLTFLVDPIAGTVQPGYSIGTGPVLNVGTPIAVGGKILDSIRGMSGMAVGLLATTGNVSTPTFNATWDYFEVLPVVSTAAAKMTVNSNAGSLTTSSTNTGGSFQVENLSTAGQKIVSIMVDLRTSMLPDIVFDPAGTAGDVDGKGFDLNSFSGIGTPVGTFESPHDGIGSQDGYDVLKIVFGPTSEFRPGDLLTFSSDIDPTSVKGVPGPGPMHSASVSGLELIGATITVTFDDGTVRKVRNAGITGTSNTNKTSVGVLSSSSLPTPGLDVPGKTSPFVSTTQPTVRVSGPPGTLAKVWVFSSTLYLDEAGKPELTVPNGGYDIDPFETNTVIGYAIIDTAIGAAGFVNVPVTLSESAGGINYVAAVLVDANGKRSPSSDILVIDYDPTGTATNALVRLNAGGGNFVDGLGQTWSADFGFTSGSTATFANEIAGTTNDALYQTFRFDDSPSSPLDYSFAVPNGQYQVKLHFAETWSGITAAGQRVFDVLLEGQTVIDNLDVFAVAGPNAALVQTLQTSVADGQLTIGLRHVTQNPFICAIEVVALGSGPGPDTEPPTMPGYFSTTNLKAGSVTLNWAAASDNTAVTGYRLFRDGTEIGTTTGLSFPSSGLTPTTEYDFKIEAFDAAGNLSARSEITVTTLEDQENPTTPGSLKGVAGNGLALLSWTTSTDDAGVTGYRIYRNGNILATQTALSYTDTGLTNGTLYNYEVVAIDASGKASAPATRSVRPRALGPAFLRIDVGGTGFVDSLGTTWLADYGFNTGVPSTVDIPVAGTVDDLLYQTRRVDSSSGAEMKYTLPLPNGQYELRLHFAEVWSGASGAPGVRVFDVKVQNQLALDDLDVVAEVGYATAFSVPIPLSVTNGQAVIEFIHNVQNPMLAAIEIYELEPPPPDIVAPTMPSGLAVTNVATSSVSLSWSDSSDDTGVTGYQIHRDGVPVATVNALVFNDVGLDPLTAYQYSVSAVDSAGNVSAPASILATTLADTLAPTVPLTLKAIAGNASVALTWATATDNVAVSGYRIYRNGGLITTVPGLEFTDTGLANGSTYTFQVKAVDAAGNESAAASVTAIPLSLGAAVLRVNVGDGEYVDSFGNTWAADFGFNTGTAETTADVITGTPDPILYQSRRFDRPTGSEMKYTFDLPNGNYGVRLHFVEVWSNGFVAGARVFDVSVEGALALDNFDIFVAAGAKTAHAVTIPTTVADGKLNIDFQRVVQNPALAAIEVFALLGDGPAEAVPPSVPGSLAVSSLTTTSVGLSWTASTDNIGVVGYRIYRDNALVSTVSQLSFNDTGRASGVEYDYAVIAFDAAGNTSSPALVSATTLVPDTVPPTVPGNLAATPGFGFISLSWTASTDNIGVSGYRILKNGLLVTTVTSLGYTDLNLPSGVGYDYAVVAVDPTGNASTAAQVSASTLLDNQPPTTPTALAATPSIIGMALSWSASTDNAGVTGYAIYRESVLLTTVQLTSFQDSVLVPGTQYHYAVVALDAAGNSSTPATLAASTLPDVQAPSIPGALSATAMNASAALTWAASTDNVLVNGYQVRRNGILVATVPVPGFTDAGLVNGTLYTYEVKAVDSSGLLSLPASVSVTPKALGPAFLRVNVGDSNSYVDPAGNTWAADTGYNTGYTEGTTNAITGTTMPTLYQKRRIDRSSGAELKYQLTVPNGDYEVRLHFAEVWSGAYATGIRVFDVSLEGAITFNDLDIFAEAGANKALVKTAQTTVSDGKLTIDFQRVVQNPNLSGIEVYPVLGSGAVETEPPSIPGNLAASTVTGSSVGLSWTASTDNVGVLGYRIYRDTTLIDTVVGLSFTDTGRAPGVEYNYSVVAFDFSGNSSTPALLSVTTLVPDVVTPSVPDNFTATPGLSQVVLNWDAANDNVAVIGYRVFSGGSLLATVATPGYTDTGLASGTLVEYEVLAFDAAGNISATAHVTTTTLTDTQSPTVPANLAAVTGGATVDLSWDPATDNAGVTGYRIYRGATLLGTVQTTAFGDSGLTPHTQYVYGVEAIDSAGNASARAETTVTTLADTVAPTLPTGLEATAGVQSVALSWSASTDNVMVTGYEIRRNNAVITTVPTPGYSETGLVNGTLYTYEVRAIDAAGNASGAATDSAKPRVLGSAVARINSGGLSYTDLAGNIWAEDVGGNTATSSNSIAGTLNDTIYQTERYDTPGGANLGYNFTLPDGDYEVKLHFAETYASITAAGQRVFDVTAEGSTVIDNLDIFARAGANTALAVSFPVTVSDGQLNIFFLHGVQNPKVCGIEVFPIEAVQPPQTFAQWLTAHGLAGQTTGDSDSGGLDNLSEFELQMDPNDPADDLTFCLHCAKQGGGVLIALPVLKPIGNYYVHRDSDLTDVANVANRIDVITKAEIQAMTPLQRAQYTMEDTAGGPRAFYQLFFEPVAE